MWEGGPWQHWHLQASMYHNVPHEQVDWAALAKQWIQMQQFQQTVEDTSLPIDQEVPPPPPPPPLPPPPPPVEDSNPPLPEPILTSTETTLPGVSNGRDSQVNSMGDGTFVPRNMIGNYWGGWGMNMPAPWGPASEDSATTSTAVGKEAFEYGHMHGNLPLNAQSYEYNHGSDQYAFNQAMFPQTQSEPQFPELDSQFPLPNHQFSQPDPQFTQPDHQFPQFWQPVLQPPDILAPPSFMKKNKKDFSDNELNKSLEDTTQLDAVKRKQLPAWIREGLEKMERERQKKMEKEKAKLELEQKLKTEKEDKVVVEHGVKEEEEDTHSSPAQVLKSKFESDSETEEGPQQNFVNRSPSSSHVDKTECSSPTIPIKSEEERKQEMILKVRRLLTEILLEVTNEELQLCAEDVHKRAVNKAPARQLASSSALASLASGLGGLTGYGSNSEASGSEDSGSDDSDEELQQKIREKKKRFALKEKEILSAIGEEEAAERERENLQKQKALKEDLRQSNTTELDENEKKHNTDTAAEMPAVQNESQEVLTNSPKNKSEKTERGDIKHEAVESKPVYEENVKVNAESYNRSEESDSDTASSHSQNSEVGTGSSSSDTESNVEHKVSQVKADSSVTDSEDSSRTRSPVREKKELKSSDSHRKQRNRPSPSDVVKNRKGSHNSYSHHKRSSQRSSSERRRHNRKSDNEHRSCKSRSGSLNRERKGFRKSTSRSLSREKKDFQKSRSRSVSREKRVYHKHRSREKRVSHKSRSRSFSRERRHSHRVRSRSCSREKRDYRKSRSRSLSRERRYSHRIRSRSCSREKRSSRKSRSVSREKKGSRKSKSRSQSREKRGSRRSRSSSLSKAKKGSRKSKSRSISREKRKRSRSLNRGKEHRLSVKKSRRKSKVDKRSLSRSPTMFRSKSNNKKKKSGKHSLSPSRSPSRSPKRSKRRKSRSSSSE